MRTNKNKVVGAILLVLAAVFALGSCEYIAELLDSVNGTWSGVMTIADVESPITFDVSMERTDYTEIEGSLLSLNVGNDPFPGSLPGVMEGTIIDGDLVMTATVSDVDGYTHRVPWTGTIGSEQSIGTVRIESYEGSLLVEFLEGTYAMTK